MAEPDPYSVLGVPPGAAAAEVRRAYFQLVRQNPPEVHPEEFKRIRAAYETLRSPLRRAELALTQFDESVAEVDRDILAAAGGTGDLAVADLLLAVEGSLMKPAEDNRTADHQPIDEASLRQLADRPAGADGAGL